MAMSRTQIAATITGLHVGDQVQVNWRRSGNASTEVGLVWQPPNSQYLGLGPDLLDPNDTELVGIVVKKRAPFTVQQPPLGSVAVFISPDGKTVYAFKRGKKGWLGTGTTTPVPWTLLTALANEPERVFQPGTPPLAPTITTVTGVDKALNVVATLGDSGSSPIFDVQYRLIFEFDNGGQEDSGWISTGLSSGTFSIPNLANGVEYSVRVRAVNSSGGGIQSNLLTGTPVGVPGIPTGVSATAGDASAIVTWTTPNTDGGAQIIGYKVEKISANDNVGWIVLAANTGSQATNYTATDLTNGTAYGFRVSAVNSVGTGLPSASSVGVTPTAS